jgi:predicted nucleotidyltransferase component of viral defense system
LPSAIVEKDYYLTRVLRTLATAHGGQFVLKGGTSLSKGWQLLRRFSEDIDLLVRAEDGWGKGRKDKRLKAFQQTSSEARGLDLGEVRNCETGVHRTIVLIYASATDDLAGLSKTLLLEMGYRGGSGDSISRSIQSMVAEFAASKGHAELAQDLCTFEIEVQSVCRTCVEKLFAIHGAYELNRAAGKTRHYYDLYELLGLDEVRVFVGTEAYRECVAEVRRFSLEHFKNQPVPDGDSFARSPAFVPQGEDLKVLKQNFEAEAPLFFEQQPSLADVLLRIGSLLSRF